MKSDDDDKQSLAPSYTTTAGGPTSRPTNDKFLARVAQAVEQLKPEMVAEIEAKLRREREAAESRREEVAPITATPSLPPGAAPVEAAAARPSSLADRFREGVRSAEATFSSTMKKMGSYLSSAETPEREAKISRGDHRSYGRRLGLGTDNHSADVALDPNRNLKVFSKTDTILDEQVTAIRSGHDIAVQMMERATDNVLANYKDIHELLKDHVGATVATVIESDLLSPNSRSTLEAMKLGDQPLKHPSELVKMLDKAAKSASRSDQRVKIADGKIKLGTNGISEKDQGLRHERSNSHAVKRAGRTEIKIDKEMLQSAIDGKAPKFASNDMTNAMLAGFSAAAGNHKYQSVTLDTRIRQARGASGR